MKKTMKKLVTGMLGFAMAFGLVGCSKSESTIAQEELDNLLAKYNSNYNMMHLGKNGVESPFYFKINGIDGKIQINTYSTNYDDFLGLTTIYDYTNKNSYILQAVWDDYQAKVTSFTYTEEKLDSDELELKSITQALPIILNDSTDIEYTEDANKKVFTGTYMHQSQTLSFENDNLSIETTDSDGNTTKCYVTFMNKDENFYDNILETIKSENRKSNTPSEMMKKMNMADMFEIQGKVGEMSEKGDL